MNSESYARTERGARLVGAGIIVSRVVGLVRNRVFSHYFGDSMQADAYTAASRIPNALRNLLGEGAISASFVPVYAAALERGDEEGANALANALLGVLLASVSVLTIVGIVLAPQLATIFLYGSVKSPAMIDLTTRLLRVLFPMTGLMVISGWCLGVQNAHRRFFMSYASGAMWSIAQIAMLLIGGHYEHDLTVLVWWLSWATIAGSVLQIAAQVPQVVRLMRVVRPSLALDVAGLRDTLRNFVPVVGALGLFQISSFIDVFVASFLPTGAIASLNYANQVFLLPLSLFGVATAAAALPQMARDDARGAGASLGASLALSWERVLFYTIPSAIAFLGIGDCIIAILYQSGKFGQDERTRVYIILSAYALGLVAYASSRLIATSYQARRDYKTPFQSAAVAIVVSAVIGSSIALWFRDHITGVAGLAVGGAVGAHVNFALLWRGLRARVGIVDVSGPARVAGRSLLASIIAVVPSGALRFSHVPLPVSVKATIVIAVYCVTFTFAARQLGLAEADRLWSVVTRRRRA